MTAVQFISPLHAICLTLVFMTCGAYLYLFLRNIFLNTSHSGNLFRLLLVPLAEVNHLFRQENTTTERPDNLLWNLSAATYATIAAACFCVIPLDNGVSIADLRTGIVFFGAAEAIAIIAVYLHGWSPNSYLSLIGGYRFVALGLSYELLSMFVLIAAALPAESLQISEIVTAQTEHWNVIRQPLGLLLWILVTMGITFSGPFNVCDGHDLASGTELEVSGRQRLLWLIGRGAMFTAFCAMGAAVFLGGWLGPILPGWSWMIIKTIALILLTMAVISYLPRIPTERSVSVLWKIGLPLSFLHLIQSGIVAIL